MIHQSVILAAKRTPIGSFLGALSTLSAPHLGSQCAQQLLNETSEVSGNDIQECIMGQVLTAGSGQAPARQTALLAGLPESVAALTINKVCGSGLMAIMLADDSIRLGRSQLVLAGGQESMSQAPYLLENARNGYRMGHQNIQDSLIKDGLWDPYKQWHMGQAAELCVREFQITREEQDQFARESYKMAQKAQEQAWFQKEIAPVKVTIKGEIKEINTDEEPGKVVWDKITQLKPAFDKTGTITAANASKINDGAATVLVANESWASKKGLKPLARIITHATYAQDPQWFTTAPIGAIKKVLAQASLKVSDIDLWEINEAFAVVTLATMKELQLPREKVNIHGGAVALGHPIGASGARILTTLIYALQQHKLRRGVASLCIGGGEAVAMLIELI